MPSVMDMIRWKDKWIRMSPAIRNQLITDSIAWLESEERPKVKPEHLSFLIDFENGLQAMLNQPRLNEAWFMAAAKTYGSFPFYERFLRRVG